MSAPVVLFGARGSMGQRYRAIFRYLGVPVVPVDIADGPIVWPLVWGEVRSSRGVVFATPTSTHGPLMNQLVSADASRGWHVPILCEKPIAAAAGLVAMFLTGPNAILGPFAMMCQYQMLDDGLTEGVTRYDYFRSGQDGLAWDCISLLALARGDVVLLNDAPVWECVLNGRRLTLGDVERAYVDFVARWLREPEFQDRAWLVRAHEKAEAWRA